jgi:predicted Zn-dependent protease
MKQTYRLRQAASLMGLLASLYGCAGQSSGLGASNLSETVQQGIQGVRGWVSPLFEKGHIRNVDKYCDSLEESYEVTDNVLRVISAAGLQSLQTWQRNGFQRSPTSNKKEVEEVVKAVSRDYLWMPVNFEQALGNQLHERQEKANKILDRKAKRNQKLYNKADAALKIAAKDYTKLPYETRLYIVESDYINAEALPAGYLYVTRKATNDLDDNALQLVLGHEMAHIAKRHTSKQIQERLVDTGLAVEMMQRIMENRSMQGLDKFFSGARVIDSFNGLFARYDQEQELQADACSIRGMLSAGADPLKAREEYLRKRGTKDANSAARTLTTPRPFGLGFTDHPEDKERDRFFLEAYQHHLYKKTS